jgi:nucleotide-binding universal stress UspA family protein
MLSELERVVASVAPAIDAQGVILYGDPVDELVRASFRFDLLVLGSRGDGPAHAVQLGPVSARVTGLAACRVVVVALPVRAGRLRAEEYGARARLVPDARRGAAT